MIPQLNWRELEVLVSSIRADVEGLFVDRIIVPERARFPNRYLKGEWMIRLTGRRHEGVLLFSIRPRQAYLAWSPQKGPKAAIQATRSPFDLSLSKHLKGAKLLEIQSIPRERVIILWFSEEGQSKNRLGLVLVFIPTAPEAFLVSVPVTDTHSNAWPIISRSRTIRDETKQIAVYTPPNGHLAPVDPQVRQELFENSDSLYRKVHQELELEAFSQRYQLAQKALKQLMKQAQDRIRQSQTALREAENEENWQKWGDLLKSSLGNPPELIGSVRQIVDYETDQMIPIPCDPKLNLKEQVEKFYQNAKRRQRRIQEATLRIERFQETLVHFERILADPINPSDWPKLEKLEKVAGIQTEQLSEGQEGKPSKKKPSQSAWLGKSFISKDGLTIWLGRSKDENLELTFKHARGNDLWLHVRGRPGAHAVIPLQAKKSAPLDTLLDAAQLVIYYSGGENWGKTEVDYTFKKHVKRIKDSSEASYTHNKTLLIQPDPQRVKKLLDSSS
jgi:predicted ribosome quality control (RQC) complex YloA/Tae2 family protein